MLHLGDFRLSHVREELFSLDAGLLGSLNYIFSCISSANFESTTTALLIINAIAPGSVWYIVKNRFIAMTAEVTPRAGESAVISRFRDCDFNPGDFVPS